MQKIDVVFKDGESRRLDVFIAEAAEVTRSHAVKLIEGGAVLVNGITADKKYSLNWVTRWKLPSPTPRNTR